MYEPKYKLNQKDAARWHELLVRHCLEMPTKAGGKVKRHPKYPPLNAAENAEFERLDRKRSRKHEAHPEVKASIQRSRNLCRRADRLLVKLNKQVVKYTVDRKK